VGGVDRCKPRIGGKSPGGATDILMTSEVPLVLTVAESRFRFLSGDILGGVGLGRKKPGAEPQGSIISYSGVRKGNSAASSL
jgi:hypothetical protein